MYRGEIWQVDLDPGVGEEQQKMRPAVIVSVDGIGKLDLRVVVPLTDWKERYRTSSWMVQVVQDSENRLTKLSAADCLNIRSLSTERFVQKIGDIREDILADIMAAISIVVGIV